MNFLKDQFSTQLNWKKYRELIQKCSPPCIPFIGVYLQDMVFIDDGNLDFLEGPHSHMINWEKCVKFANCINEVRKFQKIPYEFSPVPELLDYIQNMKLLSEDHLWQLSLVVEPRENK